MSQEPTVPVTTLAGLFSLTDIRIQQLAKEGIVHRAEHGQYYLWKSIKGYIEFLKGSKRAARTQSPDAADYEKERARFTRAKADKAEVEAALIKGTAHDAQAVAAVWTDMIGNARAKLLALPTKLAAQLEGMTIAERQDAIQAAVSQALTELSDYSPEAVTGEYIRTHQTHDDEDELDAEPEPNE